MTSNSHFRTSNRQPASNLRLDYERPFPPSQALAQTHFALQPELCERLGRLTNDGPFLIYAALSAALSVWLARQNGTGQAVFASPVLITENAGARGSEAWIPICIQVDQRLSVRDFLGHVREGLLACYSRDASTAAEPFHVLLALEELHRPMVDCPADVMLTFARQGRQLRVAAAWRPALFDEASIRSFWRQFETILAAALADTAAPLERLSMLSAEERALVVEQWNSRTAAYPFDRTVVQLFEEQAARTPDAAAVAFRSRRLTYRELNRWSNRIASCLSDSGCGPESVVGVRMEVSLELIAALVGVLKSGAAYMPLDPGYPEARLDLMLREFPPRLVLTSGSPEIEPGECGNPPAAATPSNLAYVIYTSGSTGKPKCAGLVHRGWTNLLSWYTGEFQMDSRDKTLLVTSLSFDLTQKNVFAPLITGGELILSEPGPYDPRAVCREIETGGVTILNCTPSIFYALIEDSGPGVEKALRSLRLTVLGGEPILMSRLAPWTELAACRSEIANTYGPTECTDICCVHRILNPKTWRGITVPLGRPIPNSQVYLLDSDLQPVPVGLPGELCIAGEGVGRGYLNDAELTSTRFVPNPFGAGLLYRTGDMARHLADGSIDFAGRGDNQVKVRGFRVEMGEIEAQLAKHPAVQECAVIASEEHSGGRRLDAFVVPGRGAVVVRRLLALDPSETKNLFELPNGLPLFHLNRSETEFVYREIFEGDSYFRHGIHLPENALVLDVGANIGMFALAVCRKQPSAKVYCFEPVAPVYSILKRNLELHGLNAVCRNFGLSRVAGRRSFTYYPHVSIMSGYYGADAEDQENIRVFLRNQQQGFASHAASGPELDELLENRLKRAELTCDFRTLSDELRQLGIRQVDLLKIDVEKSELDVLEGIEPEDWQRVRQVVMEVHDIDGRLETILGMLRRAGFTAAVEQDRFLADSHLYNVYATRAEVRSAESVPAAEPLWASRRELIAAIQDFLAQTLPDYMVPSSIHLLARLPMTPSGKVDRRALSETARRPDETLDPYVAPSNPIEERLAQVWGEILEVDRVGVNSNFFRLGGHSLLATRTISQIRKLFQVDVGIASFFEAPTIAATARAIEAAMRAEIESLPEGEAIRVAAAE